MLSEDGEIIINTLVKPKNAIPAGASAIHGITDDMVANAPDAAEVIKQVSDITQGHTIIIYNAKFDLQWFPSLHETAVVFCAMERFAEHYGDWNEYYESYRWQDLKTAGNHAGYKLPEGMNTHRALADCLITQAVWGHLEKEEHGGM